MMKIAGLIVLVTLLSAHGVAWEAIAQNPPQSLEFEREALTLLRMVNTAQSELRRQRPTVADLNELLADAGLKELFRNAKASDAVTAVVGPHTLTLVRDENHTRYQAMVTASERCSVAFFTNESGLIYRGRALGCD
jgi:hypothetical protein